MHFYVSGYDTEAIYPWWEFPRGPAGRGRTYRELVSLLKTGASPPISRGGWTTLPLSVEDGDSIWLTSSLAQH